MRIAKGIFIFLFVLFVNGCWTVDWLYEGSYDDSLSTGNYYINAGRYEEALSSFTKAMEYNPQGWEASGGRGYAYLSLGKNEEAIKDFTQALEKNPTNDDKAVLHNGRGLGFFSIGDYENAILDYNEAIKLEPSRFVLYNNRGYAYANISQYDKAIADLNKSIELNSSNGYPWANRAFTYFSMGEYEKALLDYSKAIQFIDTLAKEKKAEVFSYRGDLYVKTGYYDLAIADYNTALKYTPDYPKAAEGLAIANARKGATVTEVLPPAPAGSAAAGASRFALIIGNADYSEFNKLPNTVNDARDISSELGKAGFTVNLLLNADRRKMQDAILQFRDNLSKNPQTAVGFIWYAGHGVQHNGENYLIPLDSGIRNVDYLETDSIPLAYLMNNLKRAGNRTNIVVLDACRNNPLTGSRGGTRGLTVVGYDAIPQSTLILYSTAANEEASDGASGERNSPFAKAFLNNIKAETEFEQTFKAIVRDTLQLTNNRQAPTRYGLIYDDFYFSVR